LLIYSALPRPNCERLGPKPNETTIVIAAVFALAGLVKGVTGLGLPTISMGLLATVMTLAMNHGMAGALTPAIASPTLTAAALACVGMGIGQALRLRLRPTIFRRWFFVGLLLLALYLIVRSMV